MRERVERFLATPLEEVASGPLRALWQAAHGHWAAAHEEAQERSDTDSAWVHALLHREEGDEANAAYWYRRAGKPVFRGSVAEERNRTIEALLDG